MPADAVAQVGEQVITLAIFQQELARRENGAPGSYPNLKAKQALLEELIGMEALYKRALAAGYDKDPQIAAAYKRQLVAKYQEDQLARVSTGQATAEEIASYYESEAERFSTAERVQAAIIVIPVSRMASPEKRAALAERATAIRAEALVALPAGTFGALALKHSEDQASRYRGGDVGWFDVGTTNTVWPGAVMEALFKLARPGDISPVVETSTAFYMVKLVARRPAQKRPLPEVQAGIVYLIQRDKEQQIRDSLGARARQGLAIRVNEALLEKISLPTTVKMPPTFPSPATAQNHRQR
jgi:parvulin-like peptidyl-prolyl isomerase